MAEEEENGAEAFEDPALDNDEAEPTEHQLSVSGLDFGTKRKVLKKLFKKYGSVVSVKRYVRGAPRRADISFSSADEMQAAIDAMNGEEIEGRKVKVRTTPVPEAEE